LPWPQGKTWTLHPGSTYGFDDVKRVIQRYDDEDLVYGNDVIFGGSGADIIHGQVFLKILLLFLLFTFFLNREVMIPFTEEMEMTKSLENLDLTLFTVMLVLM